MKTILRQFFNQERITNSTLFNVDSLYNKINHYPIVFLWSVWTAYLGFDVLSRLFSDLPFTFINIIALNYFAGGLFNQYWFLVFLPNLFFLKKWKLPSFFLLLGFVTFLYFKYLLLGADELEYFSIRSFAVIEFVRIVKFLLFTTILWAFFLIIDLQNEKYRLQIDFEKLQIEHKSLQLSPHFVINLISQFAASILPFSKPLVDDLGYLTALLSYSYKDPQHPNFLGEEIHAIENYIFCQKRRFGDKLHFILLKNFTADGVTDLPLPKWTMMTLLENVFKHGNCFIPASPGMLTMKLHTTASGMKLFTFSITNIIDHSSIKNTSKFGLATVDRILNFYFLDHFKLFISENATEFNLFFYIEYERNFTNRTS